MARIIIKVAVILILIVILLGISVMKSSISAKREEPRDNPESRPSLNKIVAGQILDSARIIIDSLKNLELQYRLKIDSMEMLLAAAQKGDSRQERTEAYYRDSLREMENYYRGLISSLHKLYGAGSGVDSTRSAPHLKEATDRQSSGQADSESAKSTPQVPAGEKTEIDR